MITILQIGVLAILIYFVALCVINLALICIGAIQIRNYNNQIASSDFDHIAKSRLSQPISVIIPAYNEAAIIIETVENVIKLNYPIHEVIVVDDGSTDETLTLLQKQFNMQRLEKHGCRYISLQILYTTCVVLRRKTPEEPRSSYHSFSIRFCLSPILPFF